MASETDTASKEVAPKIDFNVVPVEMTFAGFETMRFKFRRLLSKQLKEANQKFLGLTEKEKEAGLQLHKIDQLAGLLMEAPENVPNYEEFADLDNDSAFVAYFSKDENEELFDYLYTMYKRALYPKELLS